MYAANDSRQVHQKLSLSKPKEGNKNLNLKGLKGLKSLKEMKAAEMKLVDKFKPVKEVCNAPQMMRYKKMISRNKVVNGIDEPVNSNFMNYKCAKPGLSQDKKSHSFIYNNNISYTSNNNNSKIHDNKDLSFILDRSHYQRTEYKNSSVGYNSHNQSSDKLKIKMKNSLKIQNLIKQQKVNNQCKDDKNDKSVLFNYKHLIANNHFNDPNTIPLIKNTNGKPPLCKDKVIHLKNKFSIPFKKLPYTLKKGINNRNSCISVENRIKLFGDDFTNNSFTSSISINNNITDIFEKTANFSFLQDKLLLNSSSKNFIKAGAEQHNTNNFTENITTDNNNISNDQIFKFTVEDNSVITIKEEKENVKSKVKNSLVTFREETLKEKGEIIKENTIKNNSKKLIGVGNINNTKNKALDKEREKDVKLKRIYSPFAKFTLLKEPTKIDKNLFSIKNKPIGVSIKYTKSNNIPFKLSESSIASSNVNNKNVTNEKNVKRVSNYDSFCIDTEETNININDMTSANSSNKGSAKNIYTMIGRPETPQGIKTGSVKSSLNDSIRRSQGSPKLMKNHPDMKIFFGIS